MQNTASMGQVQKGRKISPAIAGLSAASIAAAITIVMSLGSPAPVTTQDQAALAVAADQCQLISRKLMVSTTSGSGSVRLRAGNYLSPPIILSGVPQSVVFPLPRPDTSPVEEVLTIEGHANDVIITSEVTGLRKVYNVNGVQAINLIWWPLKSC
jgi:hypothetical protein